MSNLFLLLITLIVLGFIWMMWLRQSLIHSLAQASQRRQILQKDLSKRRDHVPYLLESFRKENEVTAEWNGILKARAFFHENQSLAKEWEFEKQLFEFMNQAPARNVDFLEAKKDIQDMSTVVEKEKLSLEEAVNAFNEKRNHFPYKIAAKLFGFQPLSM